MLKMTKKKDSKGTKHGKGKLSSVLEDSIFGTKTKIAARDKARHLALLSKHSSFFLFYLPTFKSKNLCILIRKFNGTLYDVQYYIDNYYT